MKTAFLLTTLAVSTNAAAHARKCTAGCAMNSCDAADGETIVTTYDKIVRIFLIFLPKYLFFPS